VECTNREEEEQIVIEWMASMKMALAKPNMSKAFLVVDPVPENALDGICKSLDPDPNLGRADSLVREDNSSCETKISLIREHLRDIVHLLDTSEQPSFPFIKYSCEGRHRN
jgi:hypothetical protein